MQKLGKQQHPPTPLGDFLGQSQRNPAAVVQDHCKRSHARLFIETGMKPRLLARPPTRTR